MKTAYKRVLLKLSGEALAGGKGYGVDSAVTSQIAAEIKEIHDAGVQIAIVIGGGNIFRGVAGAADGTSRTAADNVGMLATMMNSLLVKEALIKVGIDARVLSAVSMEKIAEYYIADRAINHLENGRVVIIGGGTGNPYFTTDTAAALRCAETKCDVLFKATKVDGIYDSDPVKNPDAIKLPTLTHQEALSRNIKVMDSTAFSMCMDNNITINVFKLLEPGMLKASVEGKDVGSIVTKGDE